MHYEHAVDIIKNYKKNVIIEKPTFLKSEQVHEVYKLAKKQDKIISYFSKQIQ